MSAYCFMSTEKVKSLGSFTRKMNHNYRITDVPNADPDRSTLNEELIKMEDKTYVDAFKRKMIENNHTPRSNAVLGIEVLMTYNSREVDEDFDIDKWKEENVEWLKEQFGEENVVSAVLHRDEGTGKENCMHIHAMVIPMKDGKLNAKSYISGKAKLSQLQTSYGKAMEPLGLKRGLEGSVAKHKDIRLFYDELNKELKKELPSIEQGETALSYKKRADKVYKNTLLHMLDERNKAQRKLEEMATMTKTISIDERLELESRVQKIEDEKIKIEEEREKLKKEKEEAENAQKDIKNALNKIKNFNLIIEGLKNYPDRDFAKRLGGDINKVIRWESDYEKALGEGIPKDTPEEHEDAIQRARDIKKASSGGKKSDEQR